MKILIANQAFYPDVVSTGQHAADLAVALVEAGHEVTVLSSRTAYDQPRVRYPAKERWRGIDIQRISCVALPRDAVWKRAVTFTTFLFLGAIRMGMLPRPDLVITLTSPPLLCVLGAILSRLRGARLVLWIMDLNPDEAVAAGYLRRDSLVERGLRALMRFSLRKSDRVIVLDRFMRERIQAYGTPPEKIKVVAPWPHSNDVSYNHRGRGDFRRLHALEDKFVVMYSGNHSPCHPLDTLLRAALELSANKDIVFCFVGGGVEFEKVRRYADLHSLSNIVSIGYQPRSELSASLSAADLHVVVMGNAFVGIVHPCKIYNVLTIGVPILYFGPERSPVTDLSERIAEGYPLWSVRHGDHMGAASKIVAAAREGSVSQPRRSFLGQFSQEQLVSRFLDALPLNVDKSCLIQAGPHAGRV